MTKYNHNLDSNDKPNMLGDKYFAQDKIRDFYYQQSQSALLYKGMLGNYDSKLAKVISGCAVNLSGRDITISAGVCIFSPLRKIPKGGSIEEKNNSVLVNYEGGSFNVSDVDNYSQVQSQGINGKLFSLVFSYEESNDETRLKVNTGDSWNYILKDKILIKLLPTDTKSETENIVLCNIFFYSDGHGAEIRENGRIEFPKFSMPIGSIFYSPLNIQTSKEFPAINLSFLKRPTIINIRNYPLLVPLLRNHFVQSISNPDSAHMGATSHSSSYVRVTANANNLSILETIQSTYAYYYFLYRYMYGDSQSNWANNLGGCVVLHHNGVEADTAPVKMLSGNTSFSSGYIYKTKSFSSYNSSANPTITFAPYRVDEDYSRAILLPFPQGVIFSSGRDRDGSVLSGGYRIDRAQDFRISIGAHYHSYSDVYPSSEEGKEPGRYGSYTRRITVNRNTSSAGGGTYYPSQNNKGTPRLGFHNKPMGTSMNVYMNVGDFVE